MPDPYLAALSPALRTAASAIGTQALGMATALIRQCEGCRLAPYLDSKGRPTIGIGSLTDPHGNPVTMKTPAITFAQAEELFENVLQQIAPKLSAMVTYSMQPYQAAPLLSFQYNEGSTALRTSTLMREFNAGNVPAAAAQFMDWVYVTEGHEKVKVQGLVNRRLLEQAVFLGKVNPTVPTPQPAPVPAPAPTPSADDLNAAELNTLTENTDA